MNLFSAILLGQLLAHPSSATQPSVERLSWLSGNWAGCIDELVVEEHWGLPAAGILLGTARNRKGDELKLFEFLAVFEKDATLVFSPRPSGQSSVEFPVHHLGDRSVEFRNPEHDFPQFIAYQKLADGDLQVRIGRIDAQSAMEYRLQPADGQMLPVCGDR